MLNGLGIGIIILLFIIGSIIHEFMLSEGDYEIVATLKMLVGDKHNRNTNTITVYLMENKHKYRRVTFSGSPDRIDYSETPIEEWLNHNLSTEQILQIFGKDK